MKLPSVYEPKEYESNIYDLWEKSGVFLPTDNKGESFSMVMPPPNANGNLHLGHALTGAIEDTIIRFNRMQGRPSLLVPGADHAGFETWVVYEKQLAKQGKSRFDFSREELYSQVWDFVELNKQNFENQWRSLGVSCDWTRFTYTLDNKVVQTAYATFKKMWHDGLIYRGNRIVNFCTTHGTSFSDIEVEHQQEKTKLWHIAYSLANGQGELVVATTRPETKLGQAALMVNPKDPRYKKFIGQQVLQPLVPDSPIPVIADEHVDMKFGTGVVTVTPGHDSNDFEVAQRHKLPIIELITAEGKMSSNVPEQFRGLSVLEARTEVAEALEQAGHIRKIEDYTHTVGKCYRCGTVIEPLVRDQWFIDMQPLAKKTIEELKKGSLRFFPSSKLQQTITYLQNIKDWNISRQIAWGIPIPAFQNENDPTDWIFDERVDQLSIEQDGKTYHRDSDVFDTWFSSGHWPLACLGYPDNEDFQKFYPLALMETGFDILPAWVIRMMVLGLYITGQLPFKNVYLHGLVLDEKGQKMSKSKGNVIDPMKYIDEFGSDALRMGIISGTTAGSNQPFSSARVKASRNYCNKLWNIARYVEGRGELTEINYEKITPNNSADHWILMKFEAASSYITNCLNNYHLGEAYDRLYHFVWDDFADWYIEASKAESNEQLMAYVLESILKLSHPFAPFVTEVIWQTLAWNKDELLAASSWPKNLEYDAKKAVEFEQIQIIVSEARNMINQLQIKRPHMYYTNVPFLQANALMLTKLANLSGVDEVRAGKGLHLTKTPYTCWLDIDRHVSIRYSEQLEKEHAEQYQVVKLLLNRLENKAYLSKAPKQLVDQTKQQLGSERAKLQNINDQIKTFAQASKDL